MAQNHPIKNPEIVVKKCLINQISDPPTTTNSPHPTQSKSDNVSEIKSVRKHARKHALSHAEPDPQDAGTPTFTVTDSKVSTLNRC
jgi:hypothetical protein